MLDPNDKKSPMKEINSSPQRASSEETQSSEIKRCLDCGTSKTPLWRGGPAGPKSLCNACGIRSRKKRRAILGISKSEEKKPKKTSSNNNSPTNSSSTTSSTITNNTKMGSPLHQRLLAIGRKVMMQRSTVDRLGEEEQAAVLLMALSYGSVYA